MKIKDVRGIEPEADLGEVHKVQFIYADLTDSDWMHGTDKYELTCTRGYVVELTSNEMLELVSNYEQQFGPIYKEPVKT